MIWEWFSAAVVTPSDSTALTVPCLALVAATSGIIVVDMIRSGVAIPIPVVAGVPIRIQATKVYASGTTATGIISLW
jgi:ABC-type nickel/cobalt efflux system permease component RcnA